MNLRIQLIPVLTILTLLSGTPALSQQLSKEQKIQRILELSQSSKATDKMMEGIRSMMTSQVPPDQLERIDVALDKAMEVLNEKLGPEKLRPQMIAIYDEVFTDEEIGGLLIFYESPAGKALIEKMPLVLDRSMAISQAEFMKVFPEMQKAIRDSLGGPLPAR